jgi:hypothetical protein
MENKDNFNRYLRTESAAVYCGLSPRFLEKLRCVGGGPPYLKVPGHRVVLYAREDIDDWLHAGRSTPEDTPDEEA